MSAARRQAAVLIALWAAWFAPQLFSSGVPFRRDALYLYLPLRTFLRDQLLHGRLPEWFPYENLGVPFIGQIVTATFHPATWLLLPFSPAMALKLNVLLAYLAALAGGYKMARSLDGSRTAAVCGGVALAFSGYAVSMSDNLPYVVGLATLPWVGWAAVRLGRDPTWRHAAALGGLWALVLLGGDTQSFVMTPLLIIAAFAATARSWRPVVLAFASAGFAVACSAVEWLPATAVFSQSSRLTSGFIIDPLSKWAFKPMRALELVLPHLFPGNRAAANELFLGDRFTWSAGVFVGGIVLGLVLISLTRPRRQIVAFGGLALIAFWLSFGTVGGLLPIACKLVPPLAAFRFPEKYLALALVALVPLIANGAEALLKRDRWTGVVLVILGLGFAALALWFLLHPFNDTRVQNNGVVLELFIQGARGALTTSAFLAVTWTLTRSTRLSRLLPLLLAFELWTGNHNLLPTVPAALLAPERNPFAQALARPENEPPRRVLSLAHGRQDTGGPTADEAWVLAQREMLRSDVGGVIDVATLGASALPGQSQRTRDVLGPLGVHARELAPLFGAYAATVDTDALPSGGTLLAEDCSTGLALTPIEGRPTAYLAAARLATDTLTALTSSGANEIVWENGPSLSHAAGTVVWRGWEPGQLRLDVQAVSATALAINEGFSPGWSAMVDRAPTQIHPTNGIALGIEIPSGRHEVELTYATPRLKTGAALSLMGLVLLAFAAFRRPRSSPS